jgi:hypothetical protein
MIQAGGETLHSETHKLINSIWNNEDLPDQQKKLLLYQFTRSAIKLTVVITKAYHCYKIHTESYPTSFSQGTALTQTKLLGIISVGFDISGQI